MFGQGRLIQHGAEFRHLRQLGSLPILPDVQGHLEQTESEVAVNTEENQSDARKDKNITIYLKAKGA